MRNHGLVLRIGYAVAIGACVAAALVVLGLVTGFDLGRVSLDVQKQENYWYAILTVGLGVSWISYILLEPEESDGR